MKKFIKAGCCLLTLITLVALAVTPVTAYASPPSEVSGSYTFDSTTIVGVRQAGGNTIIKDMTVQSIYGDVTGTGIFERTFILHKDGTFNVQGIVTATVTTGERSGTYTQRIVATGNTATGTVEGTWIILSGTGDLANMHGHGTITGVSNVAGTYSGMVNFDPD